ncbi:MAG: hypothetical protein JW778_06110 [Candidatus Altiarchaeota archaeon]|nr:hypothetical protein [Candidatus Altiarchaeota archaeon]
MVEKRKSVPWIVFSRLLGLLCFILVVYLMNVLAPAVKEPIFHQVLALVNDNLVLLVLMSLIFLIGEVFNALPFPIDLAAPPFNAVGAILLLVFLFNIFELIDVLTGEDVSPVFRGFSLILYPLVFFIVLVVGYVGVFRHLLPELVKPKEEIPPGKSWSEVREEFREAFADFFTLLGEEVRGKRS